MKQNKTPNKRKDNLAKKISQWKEARKKEKPDMEYGSIRVRYEQETSYEAEPNQQESLQKSKKPYKETTQLKQDDGIVFSEGITQNEKHKFSANQKYFTICVYAIATIAAGALIIYAIMNLGKISDAIHQFLGVISPFIVAFFIAFIINPLIKKIEQLLHQWFHIKRVRTRVMISMLISYLIVFGIIVISIVYVLPQLRDSITDLLKKQDGLYTQAIDFLQNIEEYFPQIDFDSIEKQFQSLWPQLVNYVTGFATDLVPKILNLGISIAKIAINLLLSIAISIYMLYDKRGLSKMIIKTLYSVLPIQHAGKTTKVIRECGRIFSGFIVGKSIDSLIIGILCFFLMKLLKLPYGILLSVIVGITNMIPYFGPFIGAVPGVLLFLCIDPIDAVIFTIMIFALQQFDGWVLGPMILGESTGLTPLWVIFAITVGGAYAGVAGMFLGVPTVAVIAYLLNQLIEDKLHKKQIKIE